MEKIRTIDLWTEQYSNHYECFNGAFVDGFENDAPPFDEYRIIKNCNCIIEVSRKDIHISNKHQAIVFYQNGRPVRLMVINASTDIEDCIRIALNQIFQDTILKEIYAKFNIRCSIVDMGEEPRYNGNIDLSDEIDVGSCDRWKLLYNMLKGSYTESDTSIGNFTNDKYEFMPNLYIKYTLKTDAFLFEIEHRCAFINTKRTRIVPIQEHSLLTK